MKESIKKVLLLCMILSLTACGSSNTGTAVPNESNEEQAESSPEPVQEETVKTVSWETGETYDSLLKNDYLPAAIRIWFTITNTGTTNIKLNRGKVTFDDSINDYLEVPDETDLTGRPSILMPGETGLYSGSYRCSFDTPEEYSFTVDTDIQETDEEAQRFTVSDLNISDYEGYDGVIEVAGTISEIPSDSHGFISVVILLYNSNNQLIGNTSKIITEGFESGEVEFSATTGLHLHVTSQEVDHYIAYAYAEEQ